MIGAILNDRYVIQEKLGEGGMAIVFLAHDRQTGEDVALKLIKNRLSGTSERRFVREFRAISSLRHPNCIQVLEFGETAEFPFFTMELFRGKPITTLAAHHVSIRLQALSQAACAVDYIHEKRIIHRDIKPSNLLIRIAPEPGGGPGVQAKLMDFGLARFFGDPTSASTESQFLGTLQYCAPEQIGNGRIDSRVDLYALGLVAYELLSGCHPFDPWLNCGVQSLLRAQLQEVPRNLEEISLGVPREIIGEVMALIAKDAADRPASAAGLRDAIARHAGFGERSAGLQRDQEAFDDEPLRDVFVGREQETGVIRNYLNRALNPHSLSQSEWDQNPIASVLFLIGEAGIGKSTLMRETVRLSQGRSARVYEGRCFEGDLTPYQPFVEILKQLLMHVRRVKEHSDGGGSPPARFAGGSDPEQLAVATVTPQTMLYDAGQGSVDRARVELALVEDYSAEILRIAPDLRKWLPGEAFQQADLSRETNYVLRAIATLFAELSTLHGTLICIEDLQWTDPSTLSLLRHMASRMFRSRESTIGNNLDPPRLAICCTVRGGQDVIDRFVDELRRSRQSVNLEVQPLAERDVTELASRMFACSADQLTPSVLELLHRTSQGVPLFIRESISAWKGSRRLIRKDGCWDLAGVGHDRNLWPQSIRDILLDRLKQLTPTARRLLGAHAAIGAVAEVELLKEAAGDIAETEFLDALDELIQRKVVTETGAGRQVEIMHDLIRQIAYEDLSSNRRRALHRRIAECIERQRTRGGKVPPARLAEHFSAAGDADKALEYHVEAARSALGVYAIDDALRHLNSADQLLGEPACANTPRDGICELLGIAYSAAGKPASAIEQYAQTAASATDNLMRARALERIGAMHFRIGDFDASVQSFDSALAELKLRRSRSTVAAALNGLLSYGWHFWPRWLQFGGRKSESGRKRAAIALDVFNGLTYLWAQRSVIRTVEAAGRQLTIAEGLRDPTQLAYAYSLRALHFGIFSLNWAAMKAGRRAEYYAELSGDPVAAAVVKGHIACVHFFGARLTQAEQMFREALHTLDRRGDSWFRMYFYHNLRHTYAVLGQGQEEMECARVEIEIGEAVHDPDGNCWGSYGLANALARMGRLGEAQAAMDRATQCLLDTTNIIVVPTALQTNGFVQIQSSNYAAARELLEEACRMIRNSFAFVDYSVGCYPLLVEAILGAKWCAPDCPASPADQLRSWQASRWGLFWGSRFPNHLSHALRARGRAHYAQGRKRQAIQCFERAVRAADSIGAKYDAARAHLDLATACPERFGAHREIGRQLLADIQGAIPEAEQAS